MPKDLPGFYYDAEKNRYFPIKPRIPGSTSQASQFQKNPSSNSTRVQVGATKVCPQTRASTYRLLHLRELRGNGFSFDRGTRSFQEELYKLQASAAVFWRYLGTSSVSSSALEQTQINVQTLEGQIETDVLLAGSLDGSLSFLTVGKLGQHFDYGPTYVPDHVWPSTKVKPESNTIPKCIWKAPGASLHMRSRISCIKLSKKRFGFTNNADSEVQHALITTLGGVGSAGYVSILNLQEPVDLSSTVNLRLHAVASFDNTIWTADYNSHTSRAVIGTDLGAALVNVERGTSTWVCRSKSDILAQQFDQTGNLVLCGLRNGAIVTVDVRENQGGSSARLMRHQLPYFSSVRSNKKRLLEIKGKISPSHTIFMPSSISSLVSLQSYDQYFLASSMDGSMKLYDHRLTKRGAVQSYEGHVNSHTDIKLGVDQYERFVMSGGEDRYLRLWSIKTGKLLFEENFFNSVPITVCWQRAERCMGREDERQRYHKQLFEQNRNSGAWLGSLDGLYYMQWSGDD